MTRTPAPALLAALAVQLGLSLGHLPELHHLTQEQRAEERCRVSEVAAQLCDPGSYRDLAVRRQRIKRDQEAGEEDLGQEADISEALPFFKRAFSFTSLPLPARIQFLVNIKKNFCAKQKQKRDLCLKQALDERIALRKY